MSNTISQEAMITGDDWSYDGDQWNHCDRPAWSDDEGVACSKCQASFAWDDDEVTA